MTDRDAPDDAGELAGPLVDEPEGDAAGGAEAEGALDDDLRAEAAWLYARQDDPAAVAPSPEVAREHERLSSLLADLPDGPRDPDWQRKVLRAVEDEARPPAAWWRRRAVRWTSGAAVLAAAAVVLLVLTRRAPIDSLHVGVDRDDAVAVRGSAGAGIAGPGDRLVVEGRLRNGGELRIYRDDVHLEARCPGGDGCTRDGDRLRLVHTMRARGTYQAILVTGGDASALPGESLRAFQRAAEEAGLRVRTEGATEVR